jgi:hypothetical protein
MRDEGSGEAPWVLPLFWAIERKTNASAPCPDSWTWAGLKAQGCCGSPHLKIEM